MSDQVSDDERRIEDEPHPHPPASQPYQGLTLRATSVGLVLGGVFCACNIYFGLQTGWSSGMSMPAALIGFVAFKLASRHLKRPFTLAENVVIQTVAGAAGAVGIAGGFIGVIPSIDFLLKESEGSPVDLSLGRLIPWSLGTCFVGIVLSGLMRTHIILTEQLPFPGGTATALLISVLHATSRPGVVGTSDHSDTTTSLHQEAERLLRNSENEEDLSVAYDRDGEPRAYRERSGSKNPEGGMWLQYFKSMVIAFAVSGAFTFISYFVPRLRRLPILGKYMASHLLWTFDPSPAYVGQGIIMGTSTTLHVMLGAIIGWGILCPLAIFRGWVSDSIDDYEHGARSWILWIALAILLADSVLNLGWLLLDICPGISHGIVQTLRDVRRSCDTRQSFFSLLGNRHAYSFLLRQRSLPETQVASKPFSQEPFMSNTRLSILLAIAVLILLVCIQASFGSYIKLPATILATALTPLVVIMAVRCLGETDILPNSAIAKLFQLLFALIISASNPNAILINLLVGSISESSTQQAGNLMQDFKTAHLVNVPAKAQFYGRILGSIFGALLSPMIYRTYASVYNLPSGLFQIPSSFLWIFTARLLRGQTLPTMVPQICLLFALIFLVIGTLRLTIARARWWKHLLPNGIAVAIGMYTSPSFSLPRLIGGLISWWYLRRNPENHMKLNIIACGLVLGEGILSLINLTMASLQIPHF